MRCLVFVACLLAGCPEPPEKPQTAAPPADAGGPAAPAQASADGAAAPAGGPAGGPPAAPNPDGTPVAEGAGPGPKTPGGPGGPLPKFELTQGQTIKISGTVAHANYTTGTIVVEVLRNEKDIAEPIRLHVITMDKPGPFEFEAPKDLGAVTVLAYVGTAEQGPGPEGAVDYSDKLNVGGDAISGLALDLTAGPKAKKSK